MDQPILIQNARIFDADRPNGELGDLLVRAGVIGPAGGAASCACQTIDAHGLAAIPGLVDLHVHLRDPGQTQKEDLFSGCRAAAAGGVTSLLAMPNTTPALDSPELVADVLARAEQADARVYVAAAITKGLKSLEATDIDALHSAGAIALSDDGRPVENTRLLAQAMQRAAQLNMRVTAHCEDLFLAGGGLMNEGEVSRALGVPGIPAAAEDAGTAREIALAGAYGVPVHICHVSTAQSVAMIRDAKRRGVAVTAETCPHYFCLTDEALRARDADYRMNPPLRSEDDREAVIEGLFDGTLDAIATDHAPHTAQEKACFETAPNGSIGLETSLAAALTVLVNGRGMALSRLIELMSSSPARILGIPGGSLAAGAPADFALVDLERRWVVDPNRLHGKSQNTPFKGMELTGQVQYTFCRGKLVFCR